MVELEVGDGMVPSGAGSFSSTPLCRPISDFVHFSTSPPFVSASTRDFDPSTPSASRFQSGTDDHERT
jgi:hypothetical protein